MDADDRENLQIVIAQLHQLQASSAQSGFLQRLKLRGDVKTINLYREYVNSIASLWYSYGNVDDAMLYRGRARKKLQAAEEYYALDAMKRQIEMMQAQERLRDLQLQAEIAEIQRAQKRAEMLGGVVELKKDPVTGEYEEDEQYDAMVNHIKEQAQQNIDAYTAMRGGKGSLTDADKEYIEGIRARAEKTIHGLGL